MKSFVIAALLVALAGVATAETHAKISREDFARAINRAGAPAVPYRHGKVSPKAIKAIRCLGPDEEPTEFECAWRQRTSHGWAARRTWLAIDAEGWRVID